MALKVHMVLITRIPINGVVEFSSTRPGAAVTPRTLPIWRCVARCLRLQLSAHVRCLAEGYRGQPIKTWSANKNDVIELIGRWVDGSHIFTTVLASTSTLRAFTL